MPPLDGKRYGDTVDQYNDESCAVRAGSGPTKAHKLHLKHVLKQFQAVEKGLSEYVAKYASPYLELLRLLSKHAECRAELLAPLYLLLEATDGSELALDALVTLSPEVRSIHSLSIPCALPYVCPPQLEPLHLQNESTANSSPPLAASRV